MTELVYSDKRSMRVNQAYITRDEIKAGELAELFLMPGLWINRIQEFHGGKEYIIDFDATPETHDAIGRCPNYKRIRLDGPKKSYTIADIAKLAER